MKNIFFFLFTLFMSITFGQEINVKGQVSIHNSKYNSGSVKYVSNVTVRASFAKPVVTDELGRFKLDFVGVSNGLDVRLIAEKNGYEIVNSFDLEEVTLGRKSEIDIYLIEKGGLELAQLELLRISKEALFAKRDSIIKELQSDGIKRDLMIENLEKKYNWKIKTSEEAERMLHIQISELEKKLPDFVLKMSRKNLDRASELYIQAYRYLINGDISEVIRLLGEDKLREEREQLKKNHDEYLKYKALTEEMRLADIEYTSGVIALHEMKFDAYILDLNYPLAIHLGETILEIIREYELPKIEEAKFLDELAEVQLLMAHYSIERSEYDNELKNNFWASNAIKNYFQSCKIYQNRLPANSLRLAKAYYNLGKMVVNMYGDDTLALGFLTKSIDIYMERDVVMDEVVGNYIELGKIANRQEEYESRDEFFSLAIVAQMLLDLGESCKGDVYFEWAKQVVKDSEQYKELLMKSHLDYEIELDSNDSKLGRSYMLVGDLKSNTTKEAIAYYEKGLYVYEMIYAKESVDHFYKNRKTGYLKMADLWELLGENDKGLLYHEKYIEAFEKSHDPEKFYLDRYDKYNEIIAFHYRGERYEDVLKLQLMTYDEIIKNEDRFSQTYLASYIAYTYHLLKDYDNEIMFLDSLLHFYETEEDQCAELYYFGAYSKTLRDKDILFSDIPGGTSKTFRLIDCKHQKAVALMYSLEFEESIKYFQEVIEYHKTQGARQNEREVIVAYQNMIAIYRLEDDFKNLILYTENCIDFKKSKGCYDSKKEIKADEKELKNLKKRHKN